LLGPWCHACGQAAHDFHRKAHHLIGETLESLFHADGRFWRTLPRLVIDPDGLTRAYLAGRRASQIPPMRLVLVTLLTVFLVGGWVSHGAGVFRFDKPPTAADKAEILHNDFNLQMAGVPPGWNRAAGDWIRVHISRALDNPDRLSEALAERAHDFAFLALPISAFILAAIFLFRPGFVLFDHFVFSMHSLSFQGLLISTILIGGEFSSAAWLLLAASPVHLFVHMRGVYGTGTWGTLIRMAMLFVLSSIAFVVLLLALVIVGLQGLRA